MSFFLLFQTIFKWSIPVLLWVSHVCSETSIETNTGLSLPLSLYSQLGGSLSVTFGLSTFLFCCWTYGNLVLTGLSVSPQGRLCFFSFSFFFPSPAPSSSLFFHPLAFGFFVFPMSSLFPFSPSIRPSVSLPAGWAFICRCLFHVFPPCSFMLRRVGPLRPDAKWQLILKKKNASLRLFPLCLPDWN